MKKRITEKSTTVETRDDLSKLPKVKQPLGQYRENVPQDTNAKSWIFQTITWIALAIVGAISILAILKEINLATIVFFVFWIFAFYVHVKYLYFEK